MKLRFTDQQYLTQDQYKDASNLDARIALHQRFSTNPQSWFHWIFDTLTQLPADSKILELGCGSAEMWKECVRRIPAGWVITLTDLSDGMLDAAWRNLVPLGRNFKFEQMDAQSIPYDDKSFDVVIANHMLYHVPDREKALTEIKRVLKDNGHLIATTVGGGHMQEMYVWLERVKINERADMFSNPFTLESGQKQLQTFFSQVNMSGYIDNLEVTEIDPLIAYIRSSIGAVYLSEEKLGELKKDLTAILEKEGKIFITKDSGLFEVLK
jgi:ubiquinone/menaquinone biosynthesis C-methylase UbiE